MNPDRRDFVTLGIGALAVAALPRALRPRPALVRRQIPVMGTIAEVAVRHRDGAWAQKSIDAAFAELRRVDATMSRFRADSDIGRANAAAGVRATSVSLATAEVADASLLWARASEGRFDPCLGRASELWDVENRTSPPDEEAVRELAGGALWRALEVEADGAGGRILLQDPRAALDFGGIAKGYAVDQAAQVLRERGVYHALVNVGGDLVALGVDEDDEPWKIGIRSPESPDRLVETFRVSDEAVATSGDYLRYFQYGGRRYHHLLDPVTGAPRRTSMRSLTVAAPACVDADAAATAAFGEEGKAARALLARAAPGARIVHQA
jgi:FAD:protein FMN transferase